MAVVADVDVVAGGAVAVGAVAAGIVVAGIVVAGVFDFSVEGVVASVPFGASAVVSVVVAAVGSAIESGEYLRDLTLRRHLLCLLVLAATTDHSEGHFGYPLAVVVVVVTSVVDFVAAAVVVEALIGYFESCLSYRQTG